jgi:hypothetical protein
MVKKFQKKKGGIFLPNAGYNLQEGCSVPHPEHHRLQIRKTSEVFKHADGTQ